jgi:hypothetical protein
VVEFEGIKLRVRLKRKAWNANPNETSIQHLQALDPRIMAAAMANFLSFVV